ncbi:hypothetical protein QFZ71_004286 [Streptomyces sp. V2I9]|nr:hypothetical protein [Streptomyces sp. V2I9]
MALHTFATPGVYARERSSLSRIGTVACTAIFPPRWRAKAGSKGSSAPVSPVRWTPRSVALSMVLSLRGLTISAAMVLTP